MINCYFIGNNKVENFNSILNDRFSCSCSQTFIHISRHRMWKKYSIQRNLIESIYPLKKKPSRYQFISGITSINQYSNFSGGKILRLNELLVNKQVIQVVSCFYCVRLTDELRSFNFPIVLFCFWIPTAFSGRNMGPIGFQNFLNTKIHLS